MERGPVEPYEYEVDLRDYIKVIWDNKWIIILITLIAAGGAYGFSKLESNAYKTTTSLLITPRISEQIVRREEGGLSTVSLPATAYERSALAGDLLREVITEVRLKNQEGEFIRTASLKNRMEIDIQMEARAGANGSSLKVPLVTMTVVGGDPEEIKRVANTWAELFREKTTDLFSLETSRSFQFVSGRFENVESELRGAEEEKQEYLDEHPIDMLKAEVSALSNRYRSFLTQLQDKEAELVGKKAKLTELEKKYESYDPLVTVEQQELKSEYQSLFSTLQEKRRELNRETVRLAQLQKVIEEEPKYVELQRSVSKEAIWEFLDKDLSEERLSNLPGLKVSDQEKNEIYYRLKEDLSTTKVSVNTLKENIPQLEKRLKELKANLGEDLDQIKVTSWRRQSYVYSVYERMSDLRIEVDSLQKEVTYLKEKTKELSKTIEAKQAEIDQVQIKVAQFDRVISRLKDSYTTLSSNLETARLAKEEKESSIRIMNKAVAPERPLSRNTKQNVAVAGVLGLFVGVLAAFFKHYMEGYEEESETGGEEEVEESEES